MTVEAASEILEIPGRERVEIMTESVLKGPGSGAEQIRRLPGDRPPLRVIQAGEDELAEHRARLQAIAAAAEGTSLWERLETE